MPEPDSEPACSRPHLQQLAVRVVNRKELGDEPDPNFPLTRRESRVVQRAGVLTQGSRQVRCHERDMWRRVENEG